jgi:hypothetical protein
MINQDINNKGKNRHSEAPREDKNHYSIRCVTSNELGSLFLQYHLRRVALESRLLGLLSAQVTDS